MPFVLRDASGAVTSLHRDAVDGGEWLPDGHADVQAFVAGGAGQGAAAFERLDADFVRVLEDLIDTLILRNVIRITDLPPQAQAKLLARKNLRERLGGKALRLFEQPTDFGDII
jgi:hypothetical protein